MGVLFYLRKHRPRVVVLDSVTGLMKNDQHLNVVMRIEDCGYLCLWWVFDARDCGIPQARKRLYFVAWRLDTIPVGRSQFGDGVLHFMGNLHNDQQQLTTNNKHT